MKPLAKSVLISLRLTGTALAADAVIHNKMVGSGPTTLVVSIVMPFEKSGLLIKGVSETTKTEAKEQ